MNYKILIILFILLISPTSAIGIENTFDEQNKTLIIEDSLTENKIFEIQQVSIKPDLTTMEEVFKITSYEDYTFKNYNDFKVRWEKFEGEKRKNIFKSKWEILENVEYSVTVPDYIDIGKQITIDNIQSNEDVTYIFDSNPWLLDAGELHATNKWAVTSPNGIVTIGFDNHVVNSINPSNITFYWNTTEQIDTHIEPKYSMEWIPFSPAGKTIKKDESIIVKLTFHKKAEKGNFSIQTIPTFVGVEETNFTWWNGSWNYCINNQIPYGIRPYQLPVTISNSAGTNSETNVYFNGHAKPDFSDIRFTLDDTTVLPYWIEDRGSTGKVWVNVIDNGIVNIYYGNPSATDLSDGKNTFEFFDDFSNLDLGSNPVLSPDEPWESPDLRWGTIAYLNGIYYIYYSSGSSATADIGRATSTDLIHWTKYDNNPMIQDRIGPSLLKELDGFTPVFYDNKYWMLTMKSDGNAIELRSAPSIDSNDWTLENGNLIPKVSGTWYENYLYTTSFVRENDKYYISLEGKDNSQIWRIGLFDGGSSPTGPYVDQGVLLSATLPWEGGAILDPEMRKFGDTYYLFYTGNIARPDYQNSYATSSTLSGPYVKSEIKITPISNTYPAILEKDDFYYILTDDHIPIEGIGKNLYKRKDLNGMFGSPFDWYQGGSPTFSNSELLINADGDYIRSQSAFLYKAMKIRAKFAPLSDQNSYQYFGFAANSFGGVFNSEMIVSYDNPELQAWSGNTVNYENSSIYDPSYFGSYHDYEILWGDEEAKFIVDDVLKTTQTAYVANTSQPVGIFNHKTNADLYVDWVFVRNYVTPELTWAIWSIEHIYQTGNAPVITDFSPASPVADDEGATRAFSINIDQSVDVVWYLNDDVVKNSEMGVTQATYTTTSASIGTWNVKATATNTNGTVSKEWSWTVTANSPDDWYNTNWKYRKAIEINNTGNNLIDYQIDVTIDTQSLISSDKLKSDGSDLRFVDSNNNLLPLWNEDEFNLADTTIWVMVPVVSNADETTIYMYYGNPDANTIADGDETFEFFETNFMKPLDNSDSYLNTPTYNGSGQAIHPDIYYNSSGWNGYSYWMVMTPYPGGDDNYENPSILVSNDGISWTVPGGLTNPIDPTPETGSNSDTEIVYNENLDRLEVYYVESGNGTSYLKRRTSTDGISWSNEENIFNLPDYQVMSPAIIKDGSTYHMWYNDADSCSASENYIQYITSLDGVNWSAPQSVNINQPGQNVWHSDVKFIPFKNEYWMMYAAYPVGSDCSDTELYFATSTDKFNWTTYSDKILAKGRSWDSGQIYRAAFLYDSNTDNLRVWYSARNNSGDWHTGYTQRQYSYFADGLRWSRNGNSGSNTTNPRDGNYGLMQVGGTPYPVHELSVRSNSKGSYNYTVWYKDELSTNSNYQATLNLHHGETWSNVGVYTGASSNNYTRAISGSYTDTGIARTPGWHKFEISLTDTGMCFVIDGVPAGSTTSITSSSSVTPGIEGYLAGIAYFDDYYIRKYACPEPTYMLGEEELEFELELVTIDDGDSGSSSGSSSSGGGGGGTSGEAFENILLSETDRKNVYKNADISYSFDLEGNIIRYVNFTGLTSSGKVAAKVEILNNTSSMVDSAAPEIVYKNVNIFVGIAGWATSQNIVNPTISFIVEKNWINDNNIDVNSIHIYRYSNGVWKQLPTFQTGEDTDYLFFESETPDGYSQFAVSGKVSTVTPGGESTEPTTGDITGNTTEHIPEEKPGIPGFSLLMGLLVVLIVVQWQRKK